MMEWFNILRARLRALFRRVGVSAADPLTFILISLLLSLVALPACYLPAVKLSPSDSR